MLLVDIGQFFHLARAGQHSQQISDGPHLADGHHLLEEVVERELAGADLVGGGLGLLGVEVLLGLLDEAEHVAHAEDATGHAVGVEDVEIFELLAGRREHDGLPGHLAHAQCCAAAGIAVELGQHDTGEADSVAERLGGTDGVLADHGVENEQGFVRLDRVANPGGLAHQLGVDTETACGVDDDHVVLLAASLGHSGSGHLDRVRGRHAERVLATADGRARVRGEDCRACPFADDLELADGTGTLQVTGDEKRGVTLTLQPLGELARQGRLTGTLQAGQHDDGGRVLGEHQSACFAAEDADQFLVDDLDDLLSRVECARYFGTLGADLDAVDELPHDGQRHVRLEQGQSDLAGCGVDIRTGQSTFATQVLESPGQPVGKGFEHRLHS